MPAAAPRAPAAMPAPSQPTHLRRTSPHAAHDVLRCVRRATTSTPMKSLTPRRGSRRSSPRFILYPPQKLCIEKALKFLPKLKEGLAAWYEAQAGDEFDEADAPEPDF